MADKYKRNRNDKRVRKGLLLAIIMAVLFWEMSLSVLAAGEGSTQQGAAQDPGASDITVPDTSVPYAANPGKASVAEVVSNSGHNSVDKPKEFENDLPSATVVETFTSTDLSDLDPEDKIRDLQPTNKTATLTDSGDTIREGDLKKIDLDHADVKVEAGTPAETDTTVTITKTSVTSSTNAIQKAIEKALDNVSSDTKYVTVTVAAGEYDGEVNISRATLQELFADNDDFTLYLLGEGSYDKPEEGHLIDKTTISNASGSDVVFGGILNIDGINTVLAGIYFSIENSIKIKGDCNVKIFGTAEGDGVNVELTGGSTTLDIDTGEGSDSVNLTTQKGRSGSNFTNTVDIKTGNGNDSVAINHGGGVLRANVETGLGDDDFQITGGADVVRQYQDSAGVHNSRLWTELGGGDDTVAFDASAAKAFATAYVYGGEGFNMLSLSGMLNGDLEDGKASIRGGLNKAALGGTYSGSVWMYADGSQNEGELYISDFSAFTDTLNNKPEKKLDKLDGANISSFTNYKYDADDDEDPVSADWTNEAKYGSILFTNLLVSGDEVEIGDLNIPTVNLTVTAQKIAVSGNVTASSVLLNASDNDTLFNFEDEAGQFVSDQLGGALTGSLFDFSASAEIEIEEDASVKAVNGSVIMSALVDQTHALIDLLGSVTEGLNFFNIKVGSATITIYGGIEALRNVTAASKANVSMEASNAALASVFVPVSFVVAVTETAVKIINANIKAGCDVSATTESTASLKAEATTGALPVSISVAVAVNDSHVLVGGNSVIDAGGDVILDNKAATSAEASAKRGTLAANASAYVAIEVAVQDSYAKIQDTASVMAGGNINLSSAGNLSGIASATSAQPLPDATGAGVEAGGTPSVGESLSSIGGMLGEIGMRLGGSLLAKLGIVSEFVTGKAYKVTYNTSENGTITGPASANGFRQVTDAIFQENVQYFKEVKGEKVQDMSTAVAPGQPVPKTTKYYVRTEPVRIVVTPNEGYVVNYLTVTYLKKGASAKTVVTSAGGPNNALGLIQKEDGSFIFNMPDADVTIGVVFKEGTNTQNPEEDTTDPSLSDLFNEGVGGATDDETDRPEETDSTSDIGVSLKVGENEAMYQLTLDTMFEEGVTYYTKKTEGEGASAKVTFEKATITAEMMEDPVPENTYYERIGTIVLSAACVDPKGVVQITPSPMKDKVMTGLKATYKSQYLIETEPNFKENRRYWELVDGKMQSASGVTAGQPIPQGKTYYYFVPFAQARTVEIDVTADSSGRYRFTIPGDVYMNRQDANDPNNGITFIPAFGDKTGYAAAQTPATPSDAATAQSAGALAGAVNVNNNEASITTSGIVSAGGSVSLSATDRKSVV